MTRSAATVAGAVVVGLVAVACALAWSERSALVPRGGGTEGGSAWAFLGVLAGAFVAYIAALACIRRAGLSLPLATALAVLVQLVPLGAPLLLSTDAWSYWAYGWIAARSDANPYTDAPQAVPGNPALPHMGAAWLDTTTVYGPAFTLASEPVAAAAGSSADAAAWLFKGVAGISAVAAAILAGRLTRRRSLAVAFVGWNPVLAVHLAGGGHNDALLGALLLAALALSACGRVEAAGAAWALAILVKWVPVLFLALRAVESRASGRRVAHTGFALAFGGVLVVATWRYGLHWAGAFVPLAGNVSLETSYALPRRLEQIGVSHEAALALAATAFVVGYAWLLREAHRGRARLGLAACLVLATTPYLAVWYLGWAIPLAGADEDEPARITALVLTAYLLPQAIPLG